jgi:hypothetical protein
MMAEIKRCPECGVPEQISAEYVWLNSGAMVQKSNLSRRVGFMESEHLDPLYTEMGKIIGQPIDHLVIDIARRGTADYFNNIIQPEVRGLLRGGQVGTEAIGDFMITMGLLNGFGRYEFIEIRYRGDKDDRTIMRITEPFSILLCAGAQAGGLEVVSGNPHHVTYKEVAPGVFEVSAFVSEPSEQVEELAGRMHIPEYHHRDGNIDLPACATCGCPAALSGFQWNLERGVITNGWTGRRMVVMGPEAQDPLFQELERELGDAIPRAAVEAQRRFVMSGSYSIDEVSDEGDFRTQLALRGMGNLRRIDIGARGLRMEIDNAANFLMVVGMAPGLFEKTFGVESNVDWERSESGDLALEVTPRPA